ncbi:MAG: hypothetical protein JXM70_25190 [Pirellulales bacterium]|nr:hypothetical protein [Pirellulales bacterium]
MNVYCRLAIWIGICMLPACHAAWAQWSYDDWNPRGESTTLDGIVFNSTINCGGGQNFVKVSDGHYRFRSRVAKRLYNWYFNFKVEVPKSMIGKTVTLEVADFNRGGRTPLHNRAAVYSVDGDNWLPIGEKNIKVVDWTPTGYPRIDNAYGDAGHVPHGVRFKVTLKATQMWFASPTPFTLRHRDTVLDRLANKYPALVKVSTVGESNHSKTHGYQIRMARITACGNASKRKNIVIISGEHCSETAGTYACEGWMKEVLLHREWLDEYAFYFVPVVNVDGAFYGATYYNMPPALAEGTGTNLSTNWPDNVRNQPETLALWPLFEKLRPVFFATLHNGAGRSKMDVFGHNGEGARTLLEEWRKEVGFKFKEVSSHGFPTRVWGQLNYKGITPYAYTIETLLVHRQQGHDTFESSYIETGRQLARGSMAGFKRISKNHN